MNEPFYTHRDSRAGSAVRRLRRQTTPLGERIEARGVIASALALTALTTGLAAGGAVGGAMISSHGANKAADKQTEAANHAADVSAKSNAEALAFQKEQAARDQAIAETNRRANYDQWAAREARLGNTLGVMLGLGPREIPGYVPLAPANAAAPGANGTPSANTPGALPPVPKDLATAIAEANRIAYNGENKHNDPSYWAAHWAKDPGYTWQRLLGWQAGGADVAKAGPYAGISKAAPAARTPQPYGPIASTSTPMTLGAYANAPRSPLTPALEAPVYQPRTIGSYF